MTPDAAQSARWSPPRALVTCGWFLAAASIVWLLLAGNAVDRLFVGVIAVALVAASTYGSTIRPRLRADSEGVTVRTLSGFRNWPWHQVRIHVRQTQRLGLRLDMLELDVPEQDIPGGLIVLTKLDLGDDVEDVANRLHRISRGSD